MLAAPDRAVAALAFALVSLACSSEAPPPPPPQPLLQVHGRDIGSGFANVAVWRAGAPVANARVVVNGAELAPSRFEDGMYSGQLPAAVAPGGAVTMEVTSGTQSVTGTGLLPVQPFLEAAWTSAAVASDGDIVVDWSSPSDPDYFEVHASWPCGPSCGAGSVFSAGASERTLTIPAGALPPGTDVQIRVFAYEDGVLAGDYAPYPGYPGMNIRAESASSSVATGLAAPPRPRLEVYGRDLAAYGANVVVSRHGQGLNDAAVSVNGVALVRQELEDGLYAAAWTALSAGDEIALEVTQGDLRVTGVGHVPHAPVLTWPLDGAAYAGAVPVAWTSPVDPDYFEVIANWSCGVGCGTGTRFLAAASARSLSIPFGELPFGPIELGVFAYDDGTLTGDYTPWVDYPGMNIRAESGRVTIYR